MQITLDEGYNAMCDFVYLGYVGEVNAREISVLNYAIPEATAYKLKIEYPDKTVYELPIKNGMCSLGASIFKTACEVKCQIVAYAVEGEVYKLVRKSDIFKQEIRSSIDESGIPSYEESLDALDKILQYESNSKEYAERAEQARDTAVSAKERAVSAENTTVQKADEADKSAQSAKNSEQNAAKSAERAESVAEVATASANQARDYAKEAAKSATAAGLSADTATQATERAETAKTSAETSATQADTARQGAETARAEAVAAQNAAKVSAAQASTAAQQTTADKNITAGYAKTAKTNADNTAADRQAVQEMAEQVTADKTTVAENTAKVATDRTAAETAAQTAQAVADSLPDDYVTAVEKIAENTAEIGRVKLTDKELQRRVNALYDMGNGITHQFETDTETAYAKTVPTGAKLMSVKNVGGRSIVWNQLISQLEETTIASVTGTKLTDKTLQISGTSTSTVFLKIIPVQTAIIGHKYLFHSHASDTAELSGLNGFYNNESETSKRFYEYGKGTIFTNADNAIDMRLRLDDDVTVNFQITPQLYDLTTMFGSGNEPSTVEEFEAMFPADYYPYNAGEIISAGVTEVVEQGKNLWDEIWGEGSIDSGTGVDLPAPTAIRSKNYTPIIPNSTYIFTYAGSTKFENVKTRFYDYNKNYIGYSDKSGDTCYPNRAFITPSNAFYVRFTLPPEYGNVYKNDIALIAGSSGEYTPYHRNEYPIPEAIRNLPGYGWSAGTARNYIDYENKKYYQLVGSVDLGTLTWARDGSTNRWYNGNLPSYLSDKNAMCGQLSHVDNADNLQNGQWSHSGSGYFEIYITDVTTSADVAEKMSGVILYYELATPIVTDISDLIPDDFLRNIEVEAGGSVTFKGGNDDYRLPVPSEEEYIVKLSEVGGSI